MTIHPSGEHQQSRIGWLLLSLAVGAFAIGTAEFAVMGVLPGLSEWLNVGVPEAGRLISAYALGVVIGAPLLTIISVRVTYRTLLVGLMAWFAIANALSYLPIGYTGELAVRFFAGLPHGAFFGVAAGLTTSLVTPDKKTWAMAMTLTGLTVANIVGVPMSTILGQSFGAQTAFLVVAAAAIASAVMMLKTVPRGHRRLHGTVTTELQGMRRADVWWSLLITTLGFGGVFCVVSYLIPTVHQATSISDGLDPAVMAVYGCGMTAATLLVTRIERIGQSRAIVLALLLTTLYLAIFWPALDRIATPFLWVFALGLIPTLFIPLIQSRLISLSGSDSLLPAALTQSAINIANSVGAFAGGVSVSVAGGYSRNSLVGAVVTTFGLLLAAWTLCRQKNQSKSVSRIQSRPRETHPPS